ITWGAPPPAFNATAPIEKPTTGPPGVAAPAITAARTPDQPLFGPSQPVMISWGMTAAIYPRPDHAERDARHDIDEVQGAFAHRCRQHQPAALQGDPSDGCN